MIGILLISHGNMASGISSSLKMFFGSEIPQLETLCLSENTNPDTLGKWSSCTWTTALYTLKTKKFKCESDKIKYNQKTGRISEIYFSEL